MTGVVGKLKEIKFLRRRRDQKGFQLCSHIIPPTKHVGAVLALHCFSHKVIYIYERERKREIDRKINREKDIEKERKCVDVWVLACMYVCICVYV